MEKSPQLDTISVSEEALIANPEAYLPEAAELLEEMGPEGFALLPIKMQSAFIEIATALEKGLSEEDQDEAEPAPKKAERTDEEIYQEDLANPIKQMALAHERGEIDEDDELGVVTKIALEQLISGMEDEETIEDIEEAAEEAELDNVMPLHLEVEEEITEDEELIEEAEIRHLRAQDRLERAA